MTPPPDIDVRTFLEWALCGHSDAIALCLDLFALSHVIDDVADGDPVHAHAVVGAFHKALVIVPRNAFFRQHSDRLTAVLHDAFLNWLDANRLQQGDATSVALAYALRECAPALVLACAELISGTAWRVHIGPAVHRFNQSDEPAAFFGEHHVA